MKAQLKAPKTVYTFKLIKWDGDAPENVERPEQHPDCVEIREWQLGQPNKIVYKRDNNNE